MLFLAMRHTLNDPSGQWSRPHLHVAKYLQSYPQDVDRDACNQWRINWMADEQAGGESEISSPSGLGHIYPLQERAT